MRHIIFLALLLCSTWGWAQTVTTPPSGSKPYGTPVATPDGEILVGRTGSYTYVTRKAYTDSLIALGYTKAQVDSAIAANLVDYVPNTTTINGHALSADVDLTAADVEALPSDYVPSWSDIDDKPSVFPPAAHTHPISQVVDLQGELNDKIPLSQKGANNGVATLNGAGKVPAEQLDVSGMSYRGTWNASTNTPTLSNVTGVQGWTYAVTVAGTQNLGSGNITFSIGDFAIHNGTAWERIPAGAMPTNVVTTNTNQSSIGGTKEWVGVHTWETSGSLGSTPNTIGFAAGASGQYLQARHLTTGAASFTLRGYSAGGAQLTLNEGGIEMTAGMGGVTFGGGNVLTQSSNGTVFLASPQGMVSIRPSGTSSAVGEITITPSGAITAAGLSGTGTQMLVADAIGSISRQAIPDVSAYLPLSGGKITSGSVNPLEIERTSLNQLNLTFTHTGGSYQLGVDSDGNLRYGTSVNTAANSTVWHSGNLNPASFAAIGTGSTQVRNNSQLDARYILKAWKINAGNGLRGGGDGSSDRTVSLDLASLPAVSTIATPRVVMTDGAVTGSESRMIPADFASVMGLVQTSRTINGKALSSNVTLTAADVSAVPNTGNSTIAGTKTFTGTISAANINELPTRSLNTSLSEVIAGQTLTYTTTYTGVSSGDVIAVGVSGSIGATDLIITASSTSTAGQVVVKFYNPTGSDIPIGNISIKLKAFK